MTATTSTIGPRIELIMDAHDWITVDAARSILTANYLLVTGTPGKRDVKAQQKKMDDFVKDICALDTDDFKAQVSREFDLSKDFDEWEEEEEEDYDSAMERIYNACEESGEDFNHAMGNYLAGL